MFIYLSEEPYLIDKGLKIKNLMITYKFIDSYLYLKFVGVKILALIENYYTYLNQNGIAIVLF